MVAATHQAVLICRLAPPSSGAAVAQRGEDLK